MPHQNGINQLRRLTPLIISRYTTKRQIKTNCSSFKTFTNFAFVGPPGSGKGTYTSLLLSTNAFSPQKEQRRRRQRDHRHQQQQQHHHYPQNDESQSTPRNNNNNPILLSAGDILRDHVHRRTDIGHLVSEHQRNGTLADDNLVSNAILQYLEERMGQPNDVSNSNTLDSPPVGFLLDGFPRNVPQAELIHNHWPDRFRVHYIISVEVPDDICHSKMMGRRDCKKCGVGFNLCDVDDGTWFMPRSRCACRPSTIATDDATTTGFEEEEENRAHWVRREDDTMEIAWRRIKEFHEETKPVLDFYESRGTLIRFFPYRGKDDIHILEELMWEKIVQR